MSEVTYTLWSLAPGQLNPFTGQRMNGSKVERDKKEIMEADVVTVSALEMERFQAEHGIETLEEAAEAWGFCAEAQLRKEFTELRLDPGVPYLNANKVLINWSFPRVKGKQIKEDIPYIWKGKK